MRQSRLAPDGRPAPFRVDRLYVLTTRQCGERVPDRIEVLDHGALLDDDVRIAAFVVIAGAMQIDRARIDPGVDAQQGHTTRLISRFASAQKQPCALRYSGQIPG